MDRKIHNYGLPEMIKCEISGEFRGIISPAFIKGMAKLKAGIILIYDYWKSTHLMVINGHMPFPFVFYLFNCANIYHH